MTELVTGETAASALVPLAENPINGFNSPSLAEKFDRLKLDKWSQYLDKITEDFKTAERLLHKAGVCLDARQLVRTVPDPTCYDACDYLNHSQLQCDEHFAEGDPFGKIPTESIPEYEYLKANLKQKVRREWLEWSRGEEKFRIHLVKFSVAQFLPGVERSSISWFWSSRPILECGVEEKVAAFPQLSALLDSIHARIAPAICEIEGGPAETFQAGM